MMQAPAMTVQVHRTGGKPSEGQWGIFKQRLDGLEAGGPYCHCIFFKNWIMCAILSSLLLF